MTITALPVRNEYTSTPAQSIFNYTFKIFESTDLNVYVTPSGQAQDDAADLTTAYTVLGVGDEDGGSITLTTPASAGDLVTIVSNIPDSRTTDYQTNGDFRPPTVNADFDRVVSLVKQVDDRAGRTLSFQESTQNATELTMPDPDALSFLRWKADQSGLENVTPLSQGILVESDIVERVTDMFGLINIPSPSTNKTYIMFGLFFLAPESTPRGGGPFIWQSGLNKNLANGGTIIDPDNTGGFDGTVSTIDAFIAAQGAGVGIGCWVRQYDGINVSTDWWGVDSTGATNVVVSLKRAVDVGIRIHAPEGIFFVDNDGAEPSVNDGVRVPSNKAIIGAGLDKTVFKQGDTSRYILNVLNADPDILTENILIEGIFFDGPTTRVPARTGEFAGFMPLEQELQMQVNLIHVENVEVRNCVFSAMQGDGIALGVATFGETVYPNRFNTNVKIHHNLFDGVDFLQGGGILVGSAIDLHIFENHFRNLSAPSEPGSIDIESDPFPYAVFRNINIRNNYLEGTGGLTHISVISHVGSFLQAPVGFNISDNFFHGSGNGISLKFGSAGSPGVVVNGNIYKGNGLAFTTGFGGFKQFAVDWVITNNQFTPLAGSDKATVLLGFNATGESGFEDEITNLKFINNVVDGKGVNNLMWLGGSVDGALIEGNTLRGGLNFGIIIGTGGSTKGTLAKNIRLIDNDIADVTGSARAVNWESTDVANYSTNEASGNKVAAGNHFIFPAYKTDTVSSVTIPVVLPVFDDTVLPDSFPTGVSVAFVSTIPAVSPDPGILKTEKYEGGTTARSSVVQWFYRSNQVSGTGLPLILFRKGGVSTNTWSAWKTLTGA